METAFKNYIEVEWSKRMIFLSCKYIFQNISNDKEQQITKTRYDSAFFKL